MRDYKTEDFVHESDGLISCDYIQFGDYDNSCAVERANVRYLEENKLVDEKETGGYGYVKAWIKDTPDNRELLESLESYPCFDDELVYEIEREIEEEYIKDNDDIWRLYTPEPLREILEELDRRDIDIDVYYEAKDKDNMYFEVQAGGNGWIDLEKLAPTYNKLLVEKYPELQLLIDRWQRADSIPFPIDFYDSATDMLEHRQGATLTQEEAQEVLRYAAELERLLP